MRLRRPFLAAALFAVALVAAGCPGPQLRMQTPAGFQRYKKSPGLKMITADGVRLKVREVKNYPLASLAFWEEATERHLLAKGYQRKGKRRFKTQKGLEGATLELLMPRGAKDWVLQETIFVRGDRIWLVEVAGPFDRFAPLEKSLQAALRTFDPG